MKRNLSIFLLALVLLLSGCNVENAEQEKSSLTPSEQPTEDMSMDMWEAFELFGKTLGDDGYYKYKTYDDSIEYFKDQNGNVATLIITVQSTKNFIRHKHASWYENGYTEITYTVDDIKYQYNSKQAVGQSYTMRATGYFLFSDHQTRKDYFKTKYGADDNVVFVGSEEDMASCSFPEGTYEVELLRGNSYIMDNFSGDVFAEGKQYVVIVTEGQDVIYSQFAVPYKCDDIEGYFNQINLIDYAFPYRDLVYRDLFEKFGIKQ